MWHFLKITGFRNSVNSLDIEREALRANGFQLIYKEWDSEIFKRNIYALNLNSSSDELNIPIASVSDIIKSLELKLKQESNQCVLISRFKADNVKLLQLYQNLNFSLIECYIELDHSLKNIPNIENNTQVFQPGDINEIEEIAADAFSFSRYHSDPQIENELADKSRRIWVRNSCNGRALRVNTMKFNNHVSGFVVCNKSNTLNEDIGKLDLIAVKREFWGQGFGKQLVSSFLNFCNELNLNLAIVGTQAHNIPALRLYESMGFRVRKSYYTFHRHVT